MIRWLLIVLFLWNPVHPWLYAQSSDENESASSDESSSDSSSSASSRRPNSEEEKVKNLVTYFEKRGYTCTPPVSSESESTNSASSLSKGTLIVWASEELGVVIAHRQCPPGGTDDESTGVDMRKWKWEKYVRMFNSSAARSSEESSVKSSQNHCQQKYDPNDRPISEASSAQYWCTKSKEQKTPSA